MPARLCGNPGRQVGLAAAVACSVSVSVSISFTHTQYELPSAVSLFLIPADYTGALTDRLERQQKAGESAYSSSSLTVYLLAWSDLWRRSW